MEAFDCTKCADLRFRDEPDPVRSRAPRLPYPPVACLLLPFQCLWSLLFQELPVLARSIRLGERMETLFMVANAPSLPLLHRLRLRQLHGGNRAARVAQDRAGDPEARAQRLYEDKLLELPNNPRDKVGALGRLGLRGGPNRQDIDPLRLLSALNFTGF